MDKGIRPAARNKFVELNEIRRRGEAPYTGDKANTQFRKDVMAWLMTEYGCSLASAATHYNEAFKLVKEQNAELVSGLGRPEDKKGGRKPKATTQPAAQTNALMTSMIAAGAIAAPTAQITAAAAAVGIESLVGPPFETTEQYKARMTAELGGTDETPQGDAEAQPVLVNVVKVKDGSVVAEGVTAEKAAELIEKAKAAKKGALKIAE